MRWLILSAIVLILAGQASAQPAVGTHDRQPGQVFRDCTDCPEMVVIPAGSFVMGSTEGETSREKAPDDVAKWEKPQHRVNVRSFMLGKFEVTRGEYAIFARETGREDGDYCFVRTGQRWERDLSKNWRNPGYDQDDRHPVACVSWDDAKAYTAWLSRKTGKGYRLATEAEWEYAARAGTSTARHWGDDAGQNNANFSDSGSQWSDRSTAPAGSFRANAFGLHDMIGNVIEWTDDCWNDDYNDAPTDGSSWQTGTCQIRVLRGGSWYGYPWSARSAYRLRNGSGIRSGTIGFRVARTN
jgi:formylglycine-generating enzyme required for sulfatase activity